MGVTTAYMYEFKVDREYFQHDTFKVNGSHVPKPPHALAFFLDVLNWKCNIYRLWEFLL